MRCVTLLVLLVSIVVVVVILFFFLFFIWNLNLVHINCKDSFFFSIFFVHIIVCHNGGICFFFSFFSPVLSLIEQTLLIVYVFAFSHRYQSTHPLLWFVYGVHFIAFSIVYYFHIIFHFLLVFNNGFKIANVLLSYSRVKYTLFVFCNRNIFLRCERFLHAFF